MSSTNSANSSEVSLAARMKSYEDGTKLPKGGVIIRVDGKAFHTWTKANKFSKPFDSSLVQAMQLATIETARCMQGFRMAYTQSDEATFVLTNFDEMEGAWLGYKVQKLVSVTASIFTERFNSYFEHTNKTPAAFDARAFSVPKFDLANNIVWRFQDNQRNWVQAMGHYYFSFAEMQGRSNAEVKDMLKTIGVVDLNKIDSAIRLGTVVYKNSDSDGWTSMELDYAKVNELIGIDQPGVWGDDAYRKYEDLEESYLDEEDELLYLAENDCN